MTNTLFMSVFERTREIGLLRSLGWRRGCVLALVLGESLVLALIGELVGRGLGIGAVFIIDRSSSTLGMFGSQFTPDLFLRALVTVTALGWWWGPVQRGGPAVFCLWKLCGTKGARGALSSDSTLPFPPLTSLSGPKSQRV
jgi:hypothetical protein